MEVIIGIECYYYWNHPCLGTSSSFTSYVESTLLWEGPGGLFFYLENDVRVETTAWWKRLCQMALCTK